MARLSGMGIDMDLPSGWDGRVYRRDPEVGRVPAGTLRAPATHAVVHAANFALPVDRGDFGGGAVELMTRDNVFLALFEYGPESAGAALFASPGPPKRLDADAFRPNALQRVIEGQAGLQSFFTAANRPFCLYAVVGSFDDRARLAADLNDVVPTLSIS
jgi:hypothetical protein